MTRGPASPRWAVTGVLSFGMLIGIRAVAFGAGVSGRGNFGIGGSSAAWGELSALLADLPPLTIALAVIAVAGWWMPRARRQALLAVTLLLVANLGSTCAKVAAAWVLPAHRDTLPSGHATLALTSAAVLVLLAPGPWRDVVLPLAGLLGTLGTLGVIAALWHTPCDPLAALALMPMWLWIAGYVTQVLLGQRSVVSRRGPSTRKFPSPRHLAPGEDRPVWLLIGCGGATMAITLRGWGFEVVSHPASNLLLGMGEFLLLPVMATVVLVAVARVGEDLGAPKH